MVSAWAVSCRVVARERRERSGTFSEALAAAHGHAATPAAAMAEATREAVEAEAEAAQGRNSLLSVYLMYAQSLRRWATHEDGRGRHEHASEIRRRAEELESMYGFSST